MENEYTLDLFDKTKCSNHIHTWQTTNENREVITYWVCENLHIHFQVNLGNISDLDKNQS